MEKRIWITTENNPYNPFTQWEHWCDFDGNRMGFNTVGELAKQGLFTDNLTPFENDERQKQAIIDLIDKIGIAVGRNGAISRYVLVVEGDCKNF
jgi:hypothetical protein